MKVYNTLTRKKEELRPIEDGIIKIYVCGPTVYNYFHIGNARPFVVFDTLRKYLEYRGYKVKFVQNFTDVDDKIINKAKEEGITASEVSEKYIEEYDRQMIVTSTDIDMLIKDFSDIIANGINKTLHPGIYS